VTGSFPAPPGKTLVGALPAEPDSALESYQKTLIKGIYIEQAKPPCA
jgi:hypothetical protein